MIPRIIGIRHHSPACARLVAHVIAVERPQAVLIEGPSDFNPRLPELLLDHRLPIALYSFNAQGGRPAQCWFPLLDYSPEWVALRAGQAAGATLRFIDLPHWQYRALPEAARRTAGTAHERPRHARVAAALARRFGCDGDDALWDHLFESLPDDAHDALAARLDTYFAELRGDDPGSPQDRAREQHMALWMAWAAARFERVLVVCGGWHLPALQRLVRETAPPPEAPELLPPDDPHAAGCHLVPFEFRQVDALGGYAAGMPSPMFHQWVWQHGLHGAGERAMAQIVNRLRRAHVALSTADLIAFEHTRKALAALRGHAVPLRTDLLDALHGSVVKEALEAPPPWAGGDLLGTQHHPALREALLALTGEGGGRLHGDTPLPPLVHDAEARLTTAGVAVTSRATLLALDRRRTEDAPRSQLLWQMRSVGVSGAALQSTRAPGAARALARELAFEEHWQLQRNERWYPDLIEASVHGATLPGAARQALLARAGDADGNPAALTDCLLQAVRAGLYDIGRDFAAHLRQGLAHGHDHGALARAAQLLASVVQAGFWGEDPRELLQDTLVLLAERLLLLLDVRDGAGSAATLEADVAACTVFDTLLRLALPGLDHAFVHATLARLARSPARPPALRGAALGVAYRHADLGATDAATTRAEVLTLVRATPPRDALGDFLYGLFAAARALATEDDAIVDAVHAAIDAMGVEDFLVALPALRGAFGWFPPRERGALAARVARLLGLGGAASTSLLQVRGSSDALLRASQLQAQALAWARELALLP